MKKEIAKFIDQRGQGLDFNDLALRVFASQYECSPVYRRFCDARDRLPGRIGSWTEIPAFPADGFKEALRNEVEQPEHVFFSSGTTRGIESRSRHELSDLDTYRRGAMAHFGDLVLADDPGLMATLVLGPTASTHPHSSLGQMLSWCTELTGGAESHVAFDDEGRVDIDNVIDWLGQRAAGSAPTLLLGLSSTFTALFAELRNRRLELRLPADSRLVDTGGRKGAAPVLSSRGLIKAAWTYLHIPGYLCVNEYGMTELLSQFYDDCLLSRFRGKLSKRAKAGPAWVRTIIVDPATLEPLPPGEVGILKHLDLANWESISAIQTLDLGRACGNGFELLGRVAMAEARGCSQLMSTLMD